MYSTASPIIFENDIPLKEDSSVTTNLLIIVFKPTPESTLSRSLPTIFAMKSPMMTMAIATKMLGRKITTFSSIAIAGSEIAETLRTCKAAVMTGIRIKT